MVISVQDNLKQQVLSITSNRFYICLCLDLVSGWNCQYYFVIGTCYVAFLVHNITFIPQEHKDH